MMTHQWKYLFVALFILVLSTSFAAPNQEIRKKMADFTQQLRDSKIEASALKVGEKFPDFHLASTSGKSLSFQDLKGKNGLLVNFYRGGWCPYCNTELKKLKEMSPKYVELGYQIVAIAPEKVTGLIATSRKHELNFPLLSDKGNELAKKVKIAFALSDEIREIYKGFGIDLKESNLDERFELPVPAAYLLDAEGVVLHRFLDVDYKNRVNHQKLMEIINPKNANPTEHTVYRAKISGMTCHYCSGAIKKKLSANQNVKEALIDHETGSGEIHVKAGSLSKEDVKKIIQSAGFAVDSIQ